MFNGFTRREIQQCRKYRPLHFPFRIKMKANHGGEVVGEDGAVIRCSVKDIPVYLAEIASYRATVWHR